MSNYGVMPKEISSLTELHKYLNITPLCSHTYTTKSHTDAQLSFLGVKHTITIKTQNTYIITPG